MLPLPAASRPCERFFQVCRQETQMAAAGTGNSFAFNGAPGVRKG